ncbi:MAG: Na+-transporting NADH:ubiquinone oxidoreductase subunit A [Paraglaciecola sp.]|jgi:Na+-transporting NADH:ubiquinone oxidoreductase subunit A
MKNGLTKSTLLLSFLSIANLASAQNDGDGESNILLLALMMAVAVIVFFLIIQVADNLMRIEAKNHGADANDSNFSIFPGMGEIFRPKMADYALDKKVTYLKSGHDILLQGAPEKVDATVRANTFAVQPPNFLGMSPIPKMEVAVGDSVVAGQKLFFDKKAPTIKHVAPVSGEVIAINRGAKRSIAEVVILADKEQKFHTYADFDTVNNSREDLVNYLLEGGVWPFIRQRPFNIMADPTVVPHNIFISTFDTAPLAPDLNMVVDGKGEAFQAGLDILGKLTSGHVHLGLNAGADAPPSAIFTEATGVEKYWFQGKHPAGNVGVQIHHIAPVDAAKVAWTLDVQAVITLGNIFVEKRFNADRVVVLTGAELTEPKIVHTKIGANIGELLANNIKGENVRVVSGDILSGTQTSTTGFLNAFDDQVTVLEEGDYYEPFGWLLPLSPRPTISKTYPNGFFPDLEFKADTNTHGEKRAFVVTGQYESVLPMDLYPQHLMKAILVNDFERMEGLGIYELVEEDIALAEFACTSKQPLQKILRDGLDFMIEQG